MAENLIFEQHLEAFEPSADFPGLYGQFVPSSLFELAIGETYRIVWDDEEFLVEARDASQILDGWIYVGNGTPYGMAGNNEPFVIGVSPDGIQFFSYDEGSDHIIAIYHIVEEAVKIIVRDRDGVKHEYEGIETVTFDTTDGGKQVFSKGQAIEGVEVELDFSDGDHPIYAPDGTLVKSAIIKKPVDLVPENIAQGVTIAGIEGTHQGGGGSSIGGYGLQEILPPTTLTFSVGKVSALPSTPTAILAEGAAYSTTSKIEKNQNGIVIWDDTLYAVYAGRTIAGQLTLGTSTAISTYVDGAIGNVTIPSKWATNGWGNATINQTIGKSTEPFLIVAHDTDKQYYIAIPEKSTNLTHTIQIFKFE